MINRSNYEKIVSEFGIENLDPILKAQHSNYLEIQEFYNDDQEIKNTIDLFFRKLERFIYKYKQEESQKVVRKSSVKNSPEVIRARDDAKNYKDISTDKLKTIYMVEQSYSVEDGEDEQNRIRKAAIEKELNKRGVEYQKLNQKPEKKKRVKQIKQITLAKLQKKSHC